MSPRRSSHPLTPGNKQNIQRGRAVVATPTQREEQHMETGSDIKKVKLLTEESSVYSSSISKFVNKFIVNAQMIVGYHVSLVTMFSWLLCFLG